MPDTNRMAAVGAAVLNVLPCVDAERDEAATQGAAEEEEANAQQPRQRAGLGRH